MGTKAIDPQTIRNVTIIGDPDETARIAHRLLRRGGTTGSGRQSHVHWTAGRVEHTIRVTELSSHAPIPDLVRSIRVADGVIALANAAVRSDPRLETLLRIADDHQVARICLIHGLDQPAADHDRCVRTITDTRGAVPLRLHLPLGTGTQFQGVIDLVSMWALEPMGVEFYGSYWKVAEDCYRTLAQAVMEQEAMDSSRSPRQIPPDELHHRIRSLTRIGDIVPVLCSAAPRSDDIAPLLDAIVRYLPSPMDVCQPEHALDY
ncbi:hypothetical protein HLB23_21745 [Nocardia uniformis]|uniref:Tr-type G domain-containing protein n=1 Tax=Nocardia uniformis TaxID=53432 RepID=A0A849C7U2_9NOCA|nr:GTP-binding protein [Nocardia uniformis]NNH72450.1 hypothetical protein [Nocardia uniformis]